MRKTFSLPVAATAAGGGTTPPPPADTVDNIEHSVRLNSADSAQLTKTFSSAGNTKTNTISLWVKRNKISYALSTYQSFLSAGNNFIWHFDTSDRLGLYQGAFIRYTTQKFRDPSAWYHFVFATDTTQSAASDQIKVYVNGQLITDWDTETALTQNTVLNWNSNVQHCIGSNNSTQFPDIQIADVQSIDGLQLTPSSFGFTDSNGVWQPKAFSGSYGTNGFHLDFADTSSATALGNDVSGNNNDFTANNLVAGPAYTANSFSTEFDGTGDYLSIPDDTSLQLGNGDFTIEFWIYLDSVSGNPTPIDKAYTGSGVSSTGYLVQYASSALNFYGPSGGAITSSTTDTTGNWIHYAIVRSGTTTSIYRNGSSVGSGTDSTNYTYNTNLGIGANILAGGGFSALQGAIDGKISNVRIIKGRALYTAAFTPPSTALTATDDTVLLTCQDATVRDNSNIGHSVTANGDVAVVNEGPFNGYSGSFDGTGDYIDNTSNYLIPSTTSTFTVESWIYMTANPTNDTLNIPGLITVNSGGGASTTNYMAFGPISTRKLRVRWYDGASKHAEGSTTLALNTWYHVACSVNNNSIKFFVNGVEETLTGTTTLTNRSGDETGFAIGQSYSYASYTGRVSNLRVTSGQALYTADFTPPTADLTTTSQGATASNVKLLTCQSKTFVDNSPSAHTITVNGDAHTVSVNPHTDKYSVTFDGTGDSLSIPDNADMELGSDDFTIEFWEYHTNVNEANTFITKRLSGYAPILFRSHSYGDRLDLYVSDGSSWTNQSVANALNVNTWNHLAVVRSGTSIKAYVNGVETISLTFSGALMNNTDNWYIGSSYTSDYLDGKISNLRVVKGQALYTSNFLPSKEDLTTTSQGATASNVKLLTCQSYKIQDNSASAHTITVNGDAAPSTDAPFVTSGAGSFDGTGDYLTAGSASDWTFAHNGSTFTAECWFNTASTSFTTLLSTSATQFNPGFNLDINQGSAGVVRFTLYKGTSGSLNVTSSASSFSVNTWNHVAAVYNSSTTTLTLYINGVSAGTADGSSFAFSSSASSYTLAVGRYQHSTPGGYFNGQISNVRFTDGLARYTSNFTPPTEDFDPTDQDTTFLALQGNTLDDLSGNDHAVTANGDAATSTVSPFEPVDGSDAMLDSPTNYGSGDTVRGNYCTLNPIDLLGSGVTLSEGNLKFVTTASAVHRRCRGTIFVSSGKWYAEATLNTVGGTYPNFGIITNTSNNSDTYIGGDSESYGYNSNGSKSNNGSGTAYGATYTTGDTIGAALDLDAGTVVFYKNGVSQGTAYSSLSGSFTFGISGFGSSATWTLNFGQQPFKYPLAGYKSLCSTNLPTGTVTTSGSFTGTGTADGPFIYLNGVPTAMTINSNSVTFGTDADKLSNGFKVRSSSVSYNSTGTNTYSITTTGDTFNRSRAQTNP